jgi:hypothetical protein
MKKRIINLFSTMIVLICMTSCKKDMEVPENTATSYIAQDDTTLRSTVLNHSAYDYVAEMVLKWNEASTKAVVKTLGMPPMPESRIYAMINLTMHDALNNITPKYETYALKTAIVNNASPDAAVAQAAHDVLVSLFPTQSSTFDSLLNSSLSGIATSESKQKGIYIGSMAAKAMIDKRTNDGIATAQYNYPSRTLPGQYRATPPFDAPPYYNFISMPGWGKVQPFGLESIYKFRMVPPNDINSQEYTADFNEIKTMGCRNCLGRTVEQTQIGLFWLDNIPLSWNRIARGLITEKQLNGVEAARLLALIHMAMADANISAFDNKFFYSTWRPYTAVKLAETDGNPNTSADANWTTLASPTPPVPDYPSNHAMCASSAAEILKSYFKTDNVSFTASSNALPMVTRSFNNFSTAAREVSLSRIYAGFHFRNSVERGEEQGRKIGEYIFGHCLKEKI